MTAETPDPLAYGPTGYRCGCGKDAHSNLVPCQPEPVDYRTPPSKIAPIANAWQAWWEDHDMWDGYLLYADLPTAQHHAAVDYVGEEYGWVPGDDPADEAPATTLTWVFAHQRWHLLDDDRDTGVQLYEAATYAASAGESGSTR